MIMNRVETEEDSGKRTNKKEVYYISAKDFESLYLWVEKNKLNVDGLGVYNGSIYQSENTNNLSVERDMSEKFLKATIKFMESIFDIDIKLREED